MAWYLLWAFMTAVCAAAWLPIARRLFAGLPILPLTARRPVPWTGLDLVLVAAVYVGGYLLFARAAAASVESWASVSLGTDQNDTIATATGQNEPLELAVSLLSGMAANLATAIFAFVWMKYRTGADPADFGWRPGAWRGDLRLGCITFAAVAAPVYALQLLLSPFVDQRHPIIEVLERQPSVALYVLAGLSAVAVAPLAEEFFFRALLQGWLESARPPDVSPEEMVAPVEQPPRPLAMVVSSLLFAALHIGQGAAPVPLFFLALALGYVYQRTHRLLPCVTVHFCLNAASFALLCLSL